jgi:molybdate transport system substrate-binding protein
LVVSAASSLTEAFADIAEAFVASVPDAHVDLNTGGSTRLAEQIVQGAPVDVFASASLASMDRVIVSGDSSGLPEIFALNSMAIAVPNDAEGEVQSLEDFADTSLILGACVSAVPCGGYADAVFDKAGVTAAIDTREPDAGALTLKIELAEIDAGLVYVSDVVAAAGTITGIDIPDDQNVVAAYPIVVIGGDAAHPLAEAFVAFVLSDEGRAILLSYGFELP